MEEFLQDQIYYFLADFGTNALKFVPHLFWIFYIYNIDGNLVADALSNNLLSYTYSHSIFFYFFRPDSGILTLGASSSWYQIPNVFFDEHKFGYAEPY